MINQRVFELKWSSAVVSYNEAVALDLIIQEGDVSFIIKAVIPKFHSCWIVVLSEDALFMVLDLWLASSKASVVDDGVVLYHAKRVEITTCVCLGKPSIITFIFTSLIQRMCSFVGYRGGWNRLITHGQNNNIKPMFTNLLWFKLIVYVLFKIFFVEIRII